MNNEKRKNILFVDDEFNLPVVPTTLSTAVELLSEKFNVDTASKLSDAANLFSEKFYDVFVLDIDMTKTDDDQFMDRYRRF